MMYHIEDISYTVTEFCPGPCRYCSIWKKPDRRSEELNTSELERIFTSKYLHLHKVHLTGGEPHLSDTYLKVVDILHKYHPHIVIDTPITGWYPERHEEVAKYVLKKFELYRLDISIDGDEKTYPQIRLHRNGFNKALETIEKLKKIKGCVLRIQFTIYKENHHLIKWIYEFAKRLGVGLYIGFGRFNPERFANLQDNLEKRPLSYKDFIPPKEIRKEIYKQLEEIGFHKSRYAIKYYWQKAVWEGEKVEFECYMGQRSIDISPYGDIYPCLLWPSELHMGNIRNFRNLDELLESEKAQLVLKKIRRKECYSKCLYTCALKARLLKPKIPAHGLKKYSKKWGFVFDENDIIPLKPWWEKVNGCSLV